MSFKKILVATDLSEDAAAAANWGSRFAEMTGAAVDVAYVVPVNIPNWVSGSYDISDDEVVRDKAEQRAINWYRDQTGGTPDAVKVGAGKAADELRHIVEEDGYDLMVVAMSGKGALRKFLLGSTASALAQAPPCPLVIANPEETGLDGEHEVCVGTDFTESSRAAVDLAAELAGVLGVGLDIVHATSRDLSDLVDDEELPEEIRTETRFEAARERLERIGEDHADVLGEQEYKTRVVKDYPPHAIHEFADQPKVGIAVVGESDRSSFSQSVMGSVALKLVQEMPATIVVVPPTSKKTSKEAAASRD